MMVARRGIVPGAMTSGALSWTRNGEKFGSIGYRADTRLESGTLTLDYRHTDRASGERKDVQCIIPLSSIPLHYGGRRWYMHCPYTHRRAHKLHKFSGIEQFCHRTAIRPLPTYASQRVSGSDRVNDQRWAIRHKMGDNFSDLFGGPHKPKWMRWRTFNRYAARDAELEGRDAVYLGRLLARMGVPTLEDALRL